MIGKYLLLETRRAYRNKRFLLFTLATPLVLFLVYVQLYGKGGLGGVSTTAYLMTSMASFGAMTGAMSAGTRIAIERQSGWNRQLRLTPLTPLAYLLGKAAVAMLIAAPAILVVYLTGGLVEHVSLTPMQWLESGLGTWVAIVPFAAIGLVIGYVANPESAQAIFSLCFMTMSLLGGIWVPVEVMPKVMAHIAEVLPSYWLGQIARGPIGAGGFDWLAVPVLLAWTLVFGVVVTRRYRVDTARA
jgi:ABC-2 type transport system permease protein